MQTIAPDNLLMIPPVMPASVAPPAGGAGAPETGSSTAGAMPVGAELYSIYLQKTQELSAAQSRLEEKSKIWKPKHPKFIACKDQVASTTRSIELIKSRTAIPSRDGSRPTKTNCMSLEGQHQRLGNKRSRKPARRM